MGKKATRSKTPSLFFKLNLKITVMNAKKSLIIFGFYILWLAAVVWTFAHAANTVGENLKPGLIWFGISLVVACAGVFIAIRLNRK